MGRMQLKLYLTMKCRHDLNTLAHPETIFTKAERQEFIRGLTTTFGGKGRPNYNETENHLI